MSCPICFFREAHQKTLKRQTFGIRRFEQKLVEYKRLFVSGVRGMGSLAACGCHSSYRQAELVEWTDAFLATLQGAEGEIVSAFDRLIAVYRNFITKSQKAATDSLWSHLENQHLLAAVENPLSVGKLFFRGRRKTGFDERDLKQYFHLPFTLRERIGNQRFSVSGQPMLYLSDSILGVSKELEAETPDLAVAAFLPSYSCYYHAKIFSMTNHLVGFIENTLPGVFGARSQVTYQDRLLSPNHSTINADIHKAVLLHLCTFPVEFRGSFVAEYVLPQMLSTALLEHDYRGIIFPSTKDYSCLAGHHRFSKHDLNLGIFVPYDEDNDVNEGLLQSFSGFTLDGSETLALTSADITSERDRLVARIEGSNRNNNDYCVAAAMVDLHLEYLGAATIDNVAYFDTRIGKLELEFFAKMLRRLTALIV